MGFPHGLDPLRTRRWFRLRTCELDRVGRIIRSAFIIARSSVAWSALARRLREVHCQPRLSP